MRWFRPALAASVPAPMKIMRMNFGFAGFLYVTLAQFCACHLIGFQICTNR
jgi:hypothetical protein